ncbi:MAG TPA: carboxylesterase family protein [Polyangiaceae bacterium]|jgi:para-nitrobenzyl esterase|nr:carboxylesterase family protein [Polyangiaceae bacterium]
MASGMSNRWWPALASSVAGMAGVLAVGALVGCSSSSGGSSGGSGDGGSSATTTFPQGASSTSCGATITNGGLAGTAQGSTCEYLGVPYGAPPTGALRFMPPTPAASWSTTKDVKAFGPGCIQASSALGTVSSQSEDCLSLNVYTPKTAPKAALPVMVFIYGGAFTSGASSLYDGRPLSEAGDVVVVTINYRLGALGFLALPELDAQRSGAPSGSDGIRDQQLALQWVQDNIDVFHGDKTNVTVFGESAGSMSTCIHLVSPGSQGLAKRYIMESGACLGKSTLLNTQQEAYTISNELVSSLCTGDGGAGSVEGGAGGVEGGAGSVADPVGCLRNTPADTLMTWVPPAGDATSGVNALLGNLLGAPFAPTVEGTGGVLPTDPATLISQGSFNKDAEILAGTNKDEWGLFVQLASLSGSQALSITTSAALNAGIEKIYGAAAGMVETEYPSTDANASQVFVDLVTDYAFRCPTRDLARSTIAQGVKTYYLYSYEIGPAWHSFELVPLFGVTELQLLGAVTPSKGYTSTMLGYWTSFATSGDPNGGSRPMWPQYTPAGEEYMQLVDPTPASMANLRTQQCDFWDNFTAAPSTTQTTAM